MLTAPQKQRLQTLHAYAWADEDDVASQRPKLPELLGAIDSLEELWYASFIIQWEPENGDLEFFYTHRLCDLGLATFLYWALQPASLYTAQQQNKMDGFQASYWTVVKDIEEKILSGQYRDELIAFAPMTDLHQIDPRGLLLIPEELKRTTTGTHYGVDYSPVFEGG